MLRFAVVAAVVSILVLGAFTGSPGGAQSRRAVDPQLVTTDFVVSPSARDAHQMAYDAESNRIVLFGGNRPDARCALHDTWAYDVASNVWQNMSPSVAPPGRCCPGMTYDSAADRVILFGGAAAKLAKGLNDTWTYDLNTNTWTEVTPVVSPPGRTGGQLAYDSRLDRVILYGGHAIGGAQPGFNDTWSYDLANNTWTRANTNSPGARPFTVFDYDVESDRIVMFGGMATEPYYPDNETWVYDANIERWEEMSPTSAPSPRFAAAGAYDVKVDRVLVFGGAYETGRNDTWAYDVNTDSWSKINTPVSPSNRLSTMAYDATSDRSVLFGGTWPWGGIGEPVYNRETWVFDYGNRTWTMVLGPLSPVAAFSYSPGHPVPTEAVTFDASSSSDPDGRVAYYTWDFGDGVRTGGRILTHAFATAGTRTVTLTVIDDDGLTNSSALQVVVGPTPDTIEPTIAIASPQDGATLTLMTATISGTASDNVAVERVEVSLDNATWIVAKGTTSWSAGLTLVEGDNTIFVRVTDTSGNTATTSMSVRVVTPSPSQVWPGLWPLVVGIAGAAAVALVIIRRRRKKPATDMGPPEL